MSRAWPLAALLVASTGCAFVLNRGAIRQPLQVDSDPQGAVATHENASCRTPCTLSAPRTHDAVVTLWKEEHEPVAAVFRSRLGAKTLLNLVIPPPGFAIGFATDAASGAAFELVPPAAKLALKPSAEPPQAPPVPFVLSPLRPVAFGLTLGLGFGGTPISGGELLIQWSALGTLRVRGPWVLGASFDEGMKPPLLWEEPVGVSTLAVVGGLDLAPSRNSRFVALLQAGTHRYGGAVEKSLPAIGLRADWAVVFSDGFALGPYASWLRDLGSVTLTSGLSDPVVVGGDTFVVGLAVGALLR